MRETTNQINDNLEINRPDRYITTKGFNKFLYLSLAIGLVTILAVAMPILDRHLMQTLLSPIRKYSTSHSWWDSSPSELEYPGKSQSA